MTAQEAGRPDVAISHFERALVLAPALIDVRLLLAFALGANGQSAKARATLEDTPQPTTLPQSDLRLLADAAVQLGAKNIALVAVRQLMEANPNEADLHSTLGALLHRSGATEEAGHVLNRAVLRWPTHVPTLMNTALLLVADGNYAGALRNYDRALKSAPGHHTALWHRGMLHLTMGNFASGWTDHEARRHLPVHTVKVPTGMPAWDGKNARGKTLLLWGEQGLGDQIQGVRFARNLAAIGARVIVRCAAPLCALFATAPGVSAVYSDNDVLPACDGHVPMLSVPYLLKLFDDSQFDAGNYLHVARSETHVSAQIGKRTRAGLVWAGSPGHSNDHLRSLPASYLPSLLQGVSSQWVSLQVGARPSDPPVGMLAQHADVVDVASTLTNFVDTAHVLSALDCVVTVDTSVAHLAGALGVPTMLLLPFVPDWRWQLVREDSPWYPSMRVIRQPSPGDWGSVIDRVHRELSAGGHARAA
ncbi:MAG: tetratricopeptide repeat protein [Phycisphaerae bacterium]|nr:tetratricopeptide repeat protein [Gemmatimonadaceae bacterium]